ncbi:helix-turn-helix protein [Candidatus Arcanobacter lacustris]|uniref:Helix-turn-helix protein n=1 Tax=Candidatus Arcanibacter lacustris TaxID=1607817 RepID=A0A0F5MQK0_9RICK|nr:helix-turn-helix protein [Candidatus Arcanobacter lacustris]
MLISFNDTAKKLSEDKEVLDSYREQEPKYALIRSLIRARINSGLSQEELAKRMHTSQSSIARLEGGGQLPSINTIFKYAKATNTVPIISFIDSKAAAVSL